MLLKQIYIPHIHLKKNHIWVFSDQKNTKIIKKLKSAQVSMWN